MAELHGVPRWRGWLSYDCSVKGWFLLLCIAALALAACSSNQSPEAGGQALVPPQDVSLASPLQQELGFSSEPGPRGFQLIEMQQEADAAMVRCMQEAGFFYSAGRAGARVQPGAFVGDGSRAWIEVNGLGITKSLMNALATNGIEGAVGDADAANLDYVESLTAEQATAYDIALVGDIAPDPSGAFEPAGCWGSSYSRVVRVLSLVDEFGDDLMTLNSRLVSDPRFQTFQQQWSLCMTGAGHRYDDEQQMVDDIYARLLEIELVEVGDATEAASPAAVDALLQYELAVARASDDCRVAFADEEQRLRIDYEQEFLDDNRFRIADFLEPA